MSKKILVISTSPRIGGNSETLADKFIEGAKASGNQVEKVCLYDKKVSFCIGCLACQKTSKCILHDDVEDILAKIATADVVAFATPIYFYEMSGQMKTLLDRTNPLFAGTYSFREIVLLATSADEEASSMDGAVKGLEGWISCFEKSSLAGVVRGVGADAKGDMKRMPDLLEEAFKLGKRI